MRLMWLRRDNASERTLAMGDGNFAPSVRLSLRLMKVPLLRFDGSTAMEAARPTLIAAAMLCSCFFFRIASRTATTMRHSALNAAGTAGNSAGVGGSSSNE